MCVVICNLWILVFELQAHFTNCFAIHCLQMEAALVKLRIGYVRVSSCEVLECKHALYNSGSDAVLVEVH